MKSIGVLESDDEIYYWLVSSILPKLGVRNYNSIIRAYGTYGSHDVKIYEAIHSGRPYRVVIKFYGNEPQGFKHFLRELRALQRFENLGLDKGLYRVSHLLGFNEDLGYVICIEYAWGKLFADIIDEAIFEGRSPSLVYALSEIAYTLYLIHEKSKSQYPLNNKYELDYYEKTINRLIGEAPSTPNEINFLKSLGAKWLDQEYMALNETALVHGDCTPGNFIISDSPRIVAIDLERSRWSDPVFDLGRMSAELKHKFMLHTKDVEKASPFIQSMYDSYCALLTNGESYEDLIKRNPYYEGLTLLRIAKNNWLPDEHKRKLIDESKLVLNPENNSNP
jgi:hypothetical protein